ncbi:MAG TPA: SMC-Scp complex subunit ScpB [Spirochaetia bacterium]|nr:SMC-Scp complex subunit ScpB [Spirochaetia bacterium]
MELQNEAAIIEAILFLEADPVDVAGLARISGLSKDVVVGALDVLRQDYGEQIRGIELVEIGEGFQLIPKQTLWPALRDRYGKKNDKRLSRAAMETLSIIAYSQPITRGEIENIRGVAADSMIKLLLSRDFIREVGKKDAPGKPVQYGTTREFLHFFRLSSISDLPKLDETELDRFELNG